MTFNFEPKKNFHLVMTELKTKTKLNSGKREQPTARSGMMEESPTSITLNERRSFDDKYHISALPTGRQQEIHAFEQSGPGSLKMWLTKAARMQRPSGFSERPSFFARPHQRRGNHPAIRTTSIDGGVFEPISANDDLAADCLTDAGTESGRGVPKNRLMKRGFGRKSHEQIHRPRSSSASTAPFMNTGTRRDFSSQEGVLDGCSKSDLASQVDDLITRLESCEDTLRRLQATAEKNRAEFSSEVHRMNGVVASFTRSQELRYFNLLETVRENYNTWGQIEVGYDYCLKVIDRAHRSSLMHRFKRCMWFVLKHAAPTIIAIIQTTRAVYRRFFPSGCRTTTEEPKRPFIDNITVK